jgi:hypothetical protein
LAASSSSSKDRLRRAVALPIYAVALMLDFTAGGLGALAAWIAGDDWP